MTSRTSRHQTAAGTTRAQTGADGADVARRWRLIELWPLVLGLITGLGHSWALWGKTHFGSISDDAHYLLLARALSQGAGYVDLSRVGNPAEGLYPPGLPVLLVPAALINPVGLWLMRLESLAWWVIAMLLLYVYLRDRGVRSYLIAAALLLLALNPVAATYSTEITAEAAFLVALMAILVTAGRWERQRRTVTWAGVGHVVSLAAAIYLKSAGLVLLLASPLYFLIRRQWRRATVSAVVPGLLYLPVVIHHVAKGIPIGGTTYTAQIDRQIDTGWVSHSWHVLEHYVRYGFGFFTLAGYHGISGAGVRQVASVVLVALLLLGLVLAAANRFDLAIVAVPLYLAETTAYPQLNEPRRFVLVAPILLWWLVNGADGVGRVFGWVWRTGGRRRARSLLPGTNALRPAGAGVVVLALAVAAAPTFTTDYRFLLGGHRMDPTSAQSLRIIRDIDNATGESTTIATNYNYTVSALTGHKTRYLFPCTPRQDAAIQAQLKRANVGYFSFADYARSDHLEEACLLPEIDAHPERYVPLYEDAGEPEATYEAVGPGTEHPNLVDMTHDADSVADAGSVTEKPAAAFAGRPRTYRQLTPTGGRAGLVTNFAAGNARVTQIVLAGAGSVSDAPPRSIHIDVQRPGGGWTSLRSINNRQVGRRPAGGLDTDVVPYMLINLPPTEATAVRVEFTGDGPFYLQHLSVLGSQS